MSEVFETAVADMLATSVADMLCNRCDKRASKCSERHDSKIATAVTYVLATAEIPYRLGVLSNRRKYFQEKISCY